MIRRCIQCKFESWENTSSEYLKAIGRLKNRVKLCSSCDQNWIEDLEQELEDMLSQVEDSYDNLPENLTYSRLGDLLEDRKDSLQNAIDNLDGLNENEIDKIKQIVDRL